MEKQKDLFYSRLRELVIPIAIQSFMLSLVSATDALMLGFVDQTSLSAVSLAGQIQFILNLCVTGMAGGMAILVAQYWGKRDTDTIEHAVPIALRVNLLVGSLFTVLAFACPKLLMRLYTGDAALIEAGASYLKAVALSYVLCGISQIYLAVLKNTGRAKTSSRISSTAVVVNIIFNAVLIFGLFGAPKLGIVGAAYATVAARVVELVWSVIECLLPGRVRVRWDLLFKSMGQLGRDFWHYTVPMLCAALVWGIAYTLYSVIMGHMGSDAVAANSIVSIAKAIVSCLIRGVSGGAGVLVGNLLGAGELQTAKSYGDRLVKMAWLVGLGTGLLMMALSPASVLVTSLTEQARVYLRYMMLFCGLNIMCQSLDTTILDGIFCAGGDPQFDMIGNLFAMWGFSVPLGFIGAFVLKLPPMAVYCIVNLDEIVKLPAVIIRYKKYKWVRNITR